MNCPLNPKRSFGILQRVVCSQIFVSTYYTLLDSYRCGKQDLSNFQKNVHQLDILRMKTQCFQMNWADIVPPKKHISSRPDPQRQLDGNGSPPCCGGVWISMLSFLCSSAAMSPLRVCCLASLRSLLGLRSVERTVNTSTALRPDMGAEVGLPLPCHCHDSGGLLNH